VLLLPPIASHSTHAHRQTTCSKPVGCPDAAPTPPCACTRTPTHCLYMYMYLYMAHLPICLVSGHQCHVSIHRVGGPARPACLLSHAAAVRPTAPAITTRRPRDSGRALDHCTRGQSSRVSQSWCAPRFILQRCHHTDDGRPSCPRRVMTASPAVSASCFQTPDFCCCPTPPPMVSSTRMLGRGRRKTAGAAAVARSCAPAG
jgi:hypothetical protein